MQSATQSTSPSTAPVDDVVARRARRFLRFALVTIALTYFLISVGAIVRVSGAGMGCPDWPKCFGLLVPPTSVEQLPPLGSYHYPPGWKVESFDPLMTWIEFVNRLIGVLVGFAITATLVASVVLQRRRAVVVPTFVAFVGVLYAGWLGARVVAHELAPWIVTAHLLSAVVVVSALVVAAVNAAVPVAATQPSTQTQRKLSLATLGVGVLALLQSTVGTQVRGTLEDIARAHPEWARGAWLEHLGSLDFVHTSLALLVAAAVVVLALRFGQSADVRPAGVAFARAAAALVVAQLVVGVVLHAADLPRAMQVLHLLLGALLLGALTTAGMLARRS
jgi:cytochrome c oxidase assembly protein subunit 15